MAQAADERQEIDARIRHQLHVALARGVHRPGDVLPATSEIAREIVVSPARVALAYEALAADALVDARRDGRYVVRADAGERARAILMHEFRGLVARRVRELLHAGCAPEDVAGLLQEARAAIEEASQETDRISGPGSRT